MYVWYAEHFTTVYFHLQFVINEMLFTFFSVCGLGEMLTE